MAAICHLLPEPTAALLNWVEEVEQTAVSPFTLAQQLGRRLGAHWQADLNAAEAGFWVPEIAEQGLDPAQVFLEVFTPLAEIDFQADVQEVAWRRERVGLRCQGEYAWGVVAGMTPGRREQVGSFYWLVYRDADGQEQIVRDPLAYSLPFGATSPAELFDIDQLQAERGDKAYFAQLEGWPGDDGIITQQPPANILQIHVSTASPEGTLAGLTHIYGRIAAKLQAGEVLTPAEQTYIGYDAIQLMPIEPTIEFEAGEPFWQIIDGGRRTEDGGDAPSSALGPRSVIIRLTRPTMTNWGYDVMTLGSPAVQCTLLGSKRPSEFVDFITTLHNFPEPIRLILDVVYGHSDNQTLPLLNHHFFAGPNMYGQNLQYRQPVVRAMLLEMQRRKNQFGVDGLRVDGAQDFKYWDEASQTLYYDDDYLQLWSFIRNTDDRYGVKIVGEEARFLDWAVADERYRQERHFRQLKALGFDGLDELRRFMQALDQVVQVTGYDLDQMVALLQTLAPPLSGPALTIDGLKQMAQAWMEDVHDYCNIAHWQDGLDAAYKTHSLTVREFRRQRPYLAHNLRPDEQFDYLHPTEGSVIFYGLRCAPDGSEQLLFVANMEGAPCQLIPAHLPLPDLATDGWQAVLVTPGLVVTAVDQPLLLQDSEAVVFTRSG